MVKAESLLILGAVGIGAIYLLKEKKPEIMGGATGGGGLGLIIPDFSGMFEGIGDIFGSMGEVIASTSQKVIDIPQNIKEGVQDLVPDMPQFPDIIPDIKTGWFEGLMSSIGFGFGRGLISLPEAVVKGVIDKSQDIGKEIAEKVTIPIKEKVVQTVSGGGCGGGT